MSKMKQLLAFGSSFAVGMATACSLNCEHGGYCERLDLDDVQKAIRSGLMIERCVCPFGYVGMGCEVSLDSTTKSIDTCSIMRFISPLAGKMCERPYTEYCSFDHEQEILRYCTNGGKCKGDLIAAATAPGDTNANALFENTGCLCPSEFYGPHCEFVHHNHLSYRVKVGLKAREDAIKRKSVEDGKRSRQEDDPVDTIAGLDRQQLDELLHEDYKQSANEGLSPRKLHLLWIPFGLLLTSIVTVVLVHRDLRRRHRHDQLVGLMNSKAQEHHEFSTTEYSASDHLAPFVIPEDMSISENQVSCENGSSRFPYSFSDSEEPKSVCTGMRSFLFRYFM